LGNIPIGGNQWGYFPSASVAWRISSENFMQSLASLSDLKLRLSYGESGNNRIPNFLYLPQFEANTFYGINNQLVVGFGPKREGSQPVLANGNLVWETTLSRNVGVDIGLFSNRIQMSVDAYRNSTHDLLIEMPVPSTSGYTRQYQNVGETSNRGIEIQLSGVIVDQRDFRWNANFNVSYNRNKVESLGSLSSFLFPSGWGGGNVPSDYIVKIGHSVGSMWGLVTDGFYTVDDFNYENGVYTLKDGVPNNQGITSVAPRPGVLKFKDITGDGFVTDEDRTVIGDATPKFFGGLNQQFSYKNFDLSVFVNFQYGNDVLNANKLEFTSGYTPNSNLLATMNGRWRNVNDEGVVVTDPDALRALNTNATIWSPLTSASSFYLHSWAIEDGSFIRINNVTLGYTLPSTLLSKAGISRLRFYATANNLHVFTRYSGYDPEVNTRRSTPITPGVDYAAYPRSRAYIFGVNLTF
jgi:TonB-dependent starch-binding outer membrane protein SusC